jgi:hypothetical protein
MSEEGDLPAEEFQALLGRSGLSEEDRLFVLASYWSLSEVPPIQASHDLERYRRIEEAIEGAGSHGSELAAAVRARILEWEAANADRDL